MTVKLYLIFVPRFFIIYFLALGYLLRALARAPDLHVNIHQLVTSSNNSTQKFHTFPTKFQPGQLIKDAWDVTGPDSLDDRKTAKRDFLN